MFIHEVLSWCHGILEPTEGFFMTAPHQACHHRNLKRREYSRRQWVAARTELIAIDFDIVGTEQIRDYVDNLGVRGVLEHHVICITQVEQLSHGQHALLWGQIYVVHCRLNLEHLSRITRFAAGNCICPLGKRRDLSRAEQVFDN